MENEISNTPYQYVTDSSNAFRSLLVELGIPYDDANHETGLPDNINLFNIGVEWGKRKEANKSKEASIIEELEKMAIQSLSPHVFEMWETVSSNLKSTRNL